METLKLLKESSPILVVVVILAYFLKVFIEKRLEGLAGRVEEVARTSLAVKQDLRGEERHELVALRVAVEKWEYFLQTVVFDFTMKDPLKADVVPLYENDKTLFLGVRIAAVKASTYLRNKELEQRLTGIILKIRNTYYPLISDTMPKLIDLQAQLKLREIKLNRFQQSGVQDMSYAPTEKDREENLQLQSMMTAEVGKFSENFLKHYKDVAEQMYDLKEAINYYIYRPIRETAVDKE